MKKIILLLLLLVSNAFWSYNQTFPFVIQNSSGSALAIKTSGGSTFEYCPPNGKLVGYGLSSGKYTVNTPTATTGSNVFNVAQGGSQMTPSCNDYYVEITGLSSGNQLNIRPSAGSSSFITDKATGTKYPYANNGNYFAVKSSTTVSGVKWYEIYLTDRWSQSTGWVSGLYVYYTLSQPEALETTTLSNATNINSSSANISWNAVSCATTYDIYLNSSKFSNVSNSNTTLSGLSSATNYSCYIIAKTNSGCISGKSNSISFSTGGGGSAPSMPNGLSASAASSSSIILNWNHSTGANSYDVYTCSGSFIGNTTNNYYTVSGLTSNTYYEYKVVAKNSYGSSSFTNCQGATTQNSGNPPTIPTNFTATALSESSIELNWDMVGGAGSYEVQTCSGTFVANTSLNSLSVSGLSAATTYSYKVKAINSYGSSSFTNCQSVTTKNSSGGSVISGLVVDAVINGFKLNQVNVPSCLVKLYKAGTSTIEASVSTNSNGEFTFMNLTDQTYDIEASYTASGNTYKTKESGVAVNSLNTVLKLSKSLYEAIKKYNDSLGKLMGYMSTTGASFDLLSSYRIDASATLLNFNKVIKNNDDQVIESLGRLYIAERCVYEYFKQMRIINNEFANNSFEVFEAVASLIQVAVLSQSTSVHKSLVNLTEFINDALIEIVVLYAPTEYKNGIRIMADVELARLKNTIGASTIIRNVAEPIGIGFSKEFMKSYVNETQNIIGNIVDNASQNTYTSDFTSKYGQTHSAIALSYANTVGSQIYSQSLREDINSKAFFWIKTTLDLATVTSRGANLLLNVADIAAHTYEFILIGEATKECYDRRKGLKNECPVSANIAFLSADYKNVLPFNTTLLEQYASVSKDAIIEFEKELTQTVNDVLSDDTGSYLSHLNKLVELNDSLETSITKSQHTLMGSLPYSSIANIDSMYVTKVVQTILSSSGYRLACILSLAALSDSINFITAKDSLLSYYNAVILKDKLMSESIDSFGELVKDVLIPAYLVIDNSNFPLRMNGNKQMEVKVDFTNYGSATATNVYLVLKVDSGYFFDRDSINIGDLQSGQSATATFMLYSPSITGIIGSYSISFKGENLDYEAKGGAILTTSDPNVSIDKPVKNPAIFKIYPNPNNGRFKIFIGQYGNSVIRIYNAWGEEVLFKPLVTSGEEFNLNHLPKGIYFVTIIDEEGNHGSLPFIID